MTENNGKPKDYRKVFEQLSGTTFDGSPQALADACPWCGKNKFHLNVTTGLYHCKHCDEGRGNIGTYLTYMHQQFLDETTAEHRSALGKLRGIAPQRIQAHEWAYDKNDARWLIPFKSPGGNVVNMQQYWPDRPKPNKFNLSGLPTSIYGLDRLSDDKGKLLFLCEGPFDAIALDYSLKLNRSKYDVLATPGGFKDGWESWFKGRKVRALYDNDEGGEQHRERVRKILGEHCDLRLLKWPKGFDGCDINDVVKNHPEIKIAGWIEQNSVKVVSQPKLCITHGRSKKEEQPTEWIWP